MQRCIVSFNLPGAAKVQFAQKWHLFLLSLHIGTVTMLIFVTTEKTQLLFQKEQHRKLFCLSMLSFCSHLFSTDFFVQILTVVENRDHIQMIRGWSLFKEYFPVFNMDCCWCWASTQSCTCAHGRDRSHREGWVNQAHCWPAAKGFRVL